jgi:hypothetical protein
MPRNSYMISNITRALLAGVSAAALLIATPIVAPTIAPAAAQTRVAVSIEFRTALTPYGSWRTVPRWGEVWVPARTTRDWQPYTAGNWVYSEDYGWYWISNSEEAEWGWVTYHYGRWAFDDTSGWVWVPGDVWGPAWVDWRRGDQYVGWAPLPPDEIIVEYRESPRFWIFVRAPELIAPRLRIVFLPLDQRQTILSRTVAVNRTLVLSDRRFAVNPGISPAIIAAAARQPVRSVEVRPHVVAGTTDIRGAVQVRTEDLRRGGDRPGQSIARASVVQKTITTVEPAKIVPPPQALGPNEGGTLGDKPPRAAVGAQDRGTPGTTGTAPSNLRQQGTAPPQQQREGTAPAERTAPTDQRREGAVPRQQQREGTAPFERTAPSDQRREGAAPPQQQRKEAVPAERTAPAPQRQEGAAPRQQQREGAAPAERTAPAPQRQEGAAPLPQQRKEAVPAERGNQPPGSSGQAPAREERGRGNDDRRSQAPAPQAQPTPPPSANAPAATSPPAQSKASASQNQQDDKKAEDRKNQ